MFYEDNFELWPPLDETFSLPPVTSPLPVIPVTSEDLNPPLADDYYSYPTKQIVNAPTPPVIGPTRGIQEKRILADNHSLGSIFKEITCLCSRLHLASRVVNEAQRIATRHALNTNSKGIRNQRVSAFTAAYVFAACRQEKVPRSFVQISRACGVTTRQLSRRLHQIASKPVLGSFLKRAKAIDYLPRLCAEAGYPFKCEREARDLLEQRGVCETSQIGQAAGALLAVCGKESLETIVSVSGVCPRTVRKHLSLLNV